MNILNKKILLLLTFFLVSIIAISQTSYTWLSTAATSNWNTNTNWSPNGIPLSTDNVTIVNSTSTPVLPGNTSVNNFTMTSGSIDLGSSTLTINGTSVFTAGTMSNGTVAPVGASVTFIATTFNTAVSAICASVTINGGTFNSTTSIEKTGAANNTGSGGATFNGATTITNSGTTILRMANTTRDIYNQPVTFTNTGTSYIDVGYGAATGTQLNDNVTVNSTAGTGIRFGQGTGTVVLASGKTVTVGATGFSAGDLEFRNFTQTGSTAQSFTLTGTAIIYFETGTTFNGNVNAAAPQIFLNGTTFNGTATIEKTGATNNAGIGGNTFNGVTTLKNSGTAYFMTGNGNADVFNADVDLITTGTGILHLAYATATTSFNQNITVNATSSGPINFGSSSGLSTLAAGKTITVGALGFSGSSTLLLKNFTQTGSTAQALTLTGTSTLTIGSGSTFNGDVNFTSPQILLNGCTYNGTVIMQKTGAGSNTSTGNNTFNGTVAFTNSGSGFLRLANTNGDVFNQTLTLTNTGTGYIDIAYGAVAGSFLNDNVIVNSTGGTGIRFGQGAGSVTLAAGKTVSVGVTGYSGGDLEFRNFTQVGSTSQSFTLTGTAILYFETGATFNGDVTAASPQVYLNGTTFNGITFIEKTGATANTGIGGNTFNGITTIKNSGSANLISANTTADIFNNDLTLTATSTGLIYMGYTVSGTQFNGNIIVNSSSSGGIYFGNGAACGSTLAAGKTVSVGTGFSGSGTLQFKRFTQTGSTAQALTLTGTSILNLLSGNTFNGDVNFVAPQVYLSGTTYNGNVVIEKNGATNNGGTGGNTFNGTTILTSSGTGYLMTGNGSADSFNGDLTLNTTGTGQLYIGYATAAASLNGNVVVNCNNTGGISFGSNGGSATLASGKTITVGGSGFSAGTLLLKNFTQTGSTAQALTLTGTATLTVGTGSTFNGNVDFTSPVVLLNGCTYNGTGNFTRTGSAANQSTGGNTFNGVSTFSNTGTGVFYIDNTGNDLFNNNIIVNSTGGSDIRFGSSSGTATLASGKTITVGGLGFASGTLLLKNFTQSGGTAQSITLTGTAVLTIGSASTFNGDVTFTAPQIYLNGCTYNGLATIEKNGATNNASTGANIFNGTTIIKNSGAGIFYLGNSSADDFNSSATFIQTGAGALFPAYNSNGTFSGNISTSGTSTAITFASNTSGRVTIDGVTQAINGSSAFKPIIKRLTIASGGTLTLNVPVNISTGGDLTMSTGYISTTATNVLTLLDETVTSSIGNSSSYIDGPMAYMMSINGSSTLNFPIGKSSSWRPVTLSLTHNAATAYTYTAERFNSSAELFGYTLPGTVNKVSGYSYWDIARTASSSANLTSAVATLYYGSSGTDDHVMDYTGVTMCKSNGAGAWVDLTGVASANGNGLITTSSFTSFSKFTLANLIGGNNPLPVELLDFSAISSIGKVNVSWSTATEINNDMFSVERSTDGINFSKIGKVKGAGNSYSVLYYNFVDEQPLIGKSYYRLKQTDYDNQYSYSDIVEVDYSLSSSIKAYQNANNELQLNLSGYSANEQIKVNLYDMNGKLIFSEMINTDQNGNSNNAFLSVSDISSGIYNLSIVAKQQMSTQKLMLK